MSSKTSLLAGVASADITPPLEVGILMSSVEQRWEPFTRVRLPLQARALVLEQNGKRVALVAMDLLGLADAAVGGMRQFKTAIAARAGAGIAADDIVLTSTHTHTGPESISLTELCHTPAFAAWVKLLINRIGNALRFAAGSLRPARVGIGSMAVPGLGIYRRIKTTQGILLSHPPLPPEIIISRDGPVDDAVRLVAFLDDRNRPIAMLVNATCHPVHEMCMPHISPDYPGEMSLELERRHPGAIALFLNGAAGNINPPTVCGGPENAQVHGHRLAEGAVNMLDRLSFIDGRLATATRTIDLPGRDGGSPVAANLAAWSIGDAALLFVPGEVFVEIGLAIQNLSPFMGPSATTLFAGYADDYIGYLPTDAAFDEGGYELGPGRWARVGRGTELVLVTESLALLARLAK